MTSPFFLTTSEVPIVMHAFHSLSQQARFVACAGIALVAGAVDAAAPFTIDYPVAFATPTPQIAAGLKRISALKEYTESGAYQVATHDLNGDGVGEIIVQGSGSGWCGTGGCSTIVLSRMGGRNVTLLNRNLFGTLVVTKESVNGFRALASTDNGHILVGQKEGTSAFGRQMVYPMQAAAAGEATATAPVAAARPGGAPSQAATLESVVDVLAASVGAQSRPMARWESLGKFPGMRWRDEEHIRGQGETVRSGSVPLVGLGKVSITWGGLPDAAFTADVRSAVKLSPSKYSEVLRGQFSAAVKLRMIRAGCKSPGSAQSAIFQALLPGRQPMYLLVDTDPTWNAGNTTIQVSQVQESRWACF